MRRVVVTGLGIVSCLGNDKASVSESLREGKSGIRFQQTQADMGFRSHVAGKPEIDLEPETCAAARYSRACRPTRRVTRRQRVRKAPPNCRRRCPRSCVWPRRS